MRLRLKIGGKEYKIEISETTEGTKIKVNQKEFVFGKEEKKEIPIAKSVLPKRDLSKKEIIAPLAGVIAEIFVKEGDFIKRDQKVLSISAMKMENEIISEFEGRVKKVLVKKDQEVKEGDVLIILQ